MQPEALHPSDGELLMEIDGELGERRASEVHAHLTACQACRARKQEMSETLADFVHQRREPEAHLASIEGPRALLRARLAQLATESPSAKPWYVPMVRFGLVAAGVAAVWVLGPLLLRKSGANLIPDSHLTPGAVIAFAKEREVCSGQPPKTGYISAALGERVFQEYGIRHPRPRAYEVDYLIDPELGGSNDIQNLWPEPYSTTWNARVKDALEDRLHEMVCSGEISLALAQQEIATNWIAAYKKYFKTDQPLPAHFAFAKDQPWE
jgi:hypothetical protein